MRWQEIIYEDLAMIDIKNIEKYADKAFSRVGIDVNFGKHFIDRLQTRGSQITAGELTRLFKQEAKRWGSPIAQMGPDAEGVMKDLKTDVNVPFILAWNRREEQLQLRAKTIMKKKDFTTPNRVFPIQ